MRRPKVRKRVDLDQWPQLYFWPDLTYHYGIGPERLYRMPRWLIDMYQEQLPRILAEQEIKMANAARAPWMKEQEADDYNRALLRRLNSAPRPRPPAPPRTSETFAQDLSEMGIAVKVVDTDE